MKFTIHKLRIAIFLTLIIAVIFFTWQMFQPNSGQQANLQKGEHTVTLTDSGYIPEDITIKKGSTVTFKNDRDKAHWPASNIHPTHEIYSDFDPKRPLNADETWSFTFDRVGKWAFHDHIRSYYRGVVNVVE